MNHILVVGKGLNIFSEKIKKFSEFEDKSIKIPHMGWNQVEISQNHSLLEGVKTNEEALCLARANTHVTN